VKGAFNDIILEESAGIVGRLAPAITPCHGKLVAVDIDVSPFDNSKTKKEGVSWTYKGFDGYAPIFGYVGEEGYLANLELRPGSEHCQKGTEAFLRRTLRYARLMSQATFLVRMDAGNDSVSNIKVCREEKAHYIIKRNLRQETPEEWLEIARECGELQEPRPGKQVWMGERYIQRPEIEEPLRMVFCVTLRTMEADGQALLIPRIEVETYWTSLNDDVATVVELYRARGTSEQFHSELKTDLDLERLPSGKFQTNELVLLLGMVAYNLLRLIGQESLREADAPCSEAGFTAPVAQRDAGPGLSVMSLGEACTPLDAVLRTELPLAQDMAAGIPSIRADLRSNNTASLYHEVGRH